MVVMGKRKREHKLAVINGTEAPIRHNKSPTRGAVMRQLRAKAVVLGNIQKPQPLTIDPDDDSRVLITKTTEVPPTCSD